MNGTRYFFHADTEKYRRRQKSLMTAVVMPLLAVCVFCVVNIVLCLRTGASRSVLMLLFGVIGGCVLAGMVTGFAAAYVTEKLIRRHSRYTFFDILPRGMVFSVYAGDYVNFGRQVIQRRLYYMPFSGFTGTFRDPKKAPDCLVINGEVRMFLLDTNRLGYHIDEDGNLLFDNPELNERGFERLDRVEIRGRFGSTRGIERSIAYYYEQFKNIPEKKAFDISEHIPAHKRRKPATSNPMLELPSFDRKW
ncbi:MAG: hypothetical protein ACI4XA_01900 [Oscillospiraceae bacterium]